MSASGIVIPTLRSDAGSLLLGNTLGQRFHQLFHTQQEDNTSKKKEKKKNKKKGKNKAKEKSKHKRERSPERIDLQPPCIELDGNPSSFIVYAGVRQAVLEHQMRQVSTAYTAASNPWCSDSDSEEEDQDRAKDSAPKMPKIVGIGLRGVFELIRETRDTNPSLCVRALQALLDMLQGQTPEGLKTEPPDVMDSLYNLLMELSTSKHCSKERASVSSPHGAPSLTSLACSCLLSMVIARGDTGKILSAIAVALMSQRSLASEEIKVPGILTSLQRSVQAVLLGRTHHPDWLAHGVRKRAHIDTIPTTHIPQGGSSESALACDGRYLYIHNPTGLHKVGSGYSDTIKGHVYISKPDFHPNEKGWLAFVEGRLFYKRHGDMSGVVTVVDTITLQEKHAYALEGEGYGPNVMFSDGRYLGHVAAAKDDSFVVRTFDPRRNPMPLVSEVPLKLARKCLDVFGAAAFDNEVDIHTLNTGFDEESMSVTAAKEFALIRTPSGKVLYTGKSQALGIKQGGAAAGKWAELPITKSPKIVQASTGHEGQHSLLVAEDGSVFFVGTAKRGEDGDASLSKNRRQPKAVKPKKLIKMEGKQVVFSACNSGTSALITRDGEVYMFGKDTTHCDHTTGHVMDLKDVGIQSISLGKAHAVALNNKGQIYTFGINNKGQCGRDYAAGSSKELSSVTMAEEDEDLPEDDMMCPAGDRPHDLHNNMPSLTSCRHQWKQDQCMLCTNCGECTGYGRSCINSGRPDRNPGTARSGGPDSNPGTACGCGGGDSGCVECGVCRSCAQEAQEALGRGGDANGSLLHALARSKDIDFFMDRPFGGVSDRKMVERRHRTRLKNKAKAKAVQDIKYTTTSTGVGYGSGFELTKDTPYLALTGELWDVFLGEVAASNSDYEQDHAKLVSLPPAKLDIGAGDVPVIMMSCGLQHTVVLLENGEVYTFGSNQYGQLGVGDTNIRGSPVKVPVKAAIVLVAAGSNHTVLLAANGQVYTFGHRKGQLGRQEDANKETSAPWFALPGLVVGIGPRHGRRATWVGASGDQTFLRIDESLINAHTLTRSNVFANQNCIGLVPTGEDGGAAIHCLMINTQDGTCRSFHNAEQQPLHNHAVCLDPLYDVLWSYSAQEQKLSCFGVVYAEARHLWDVQPGYCNIFKPHLALPVHVGTSTTRSHAALHILGCLDTLATAHQLQLSVLEEEKEKQTTTKVYTKEDYSVVNRFESHGGGWGYSGHSIEAIRFMCDTDILLGGFGLFGGRGEYFGRIRLFELGPDGGDNEVDGEVLAETEEMPYECGAREKYAMLFDEPVALQANHWYVAWARISGPSSDCGSGGQLSVTTEDQVVFKFKSSKKSNNGTDVNAGQIPQLMYRLPAHDSSSTSRKADQMEPAHILAPEFSRTVTSECFDSLLKLLSWSWNTFCAAVEDIPGLTGTSLDAALLDLDRLVYMSTAGLRLVRNYVCEVYPSQGASRKTPPESTRLAECIGNARCLLWKVLAESQRHLANFKCNTPAVECNRFLQLADQILDECHATFVACFHAFYPTGSLKWACLCDLLGYIEPGLTSIPHCSRLLAAVMEALCHPTVRLTTLMPINRDAETEQLLRRHTVAEDNKDSVAQSHESSAFPLLVGHMTERMQQEGTVGNGGWSFREVLERLLLIVIMPVRQALNKEHVAFPERLVSNTCSLLAAIVSELSAAATGSETDMQSSGRPLLKSPNRFAWTNQSAYWNTGNGSPDAVCFTVDRPGIIIAGVCVYGGGGGQYEYEVELLDDQGDSTGDVSHTGRWNSLELTKGVFGPEDSVNDMAEVKFDSPVPIKEGIKYAIRLRNRGARTLNGDNGISKVKCPDGTTFTFSVCSLSNNGTNHSRGQIPHILYYSAPQEGDHQLQNHRVLAEYQARENAIRVAMAVFKSSTDLLHRVVTTTEETLRELVGQAHIFSTLLPLVSAYISPVAAIDPRGSVKILGLVQDILPPIAQLNAHLSSQASITDSSDTDASLLDMGASSQQHYAIVESDHPYKPATVANYKVTFPDSVQWLALEFDSQCGTAQAEDSLQLYIPACRKHQVKPLLTSVGKDVQKNTSWWPVFKKFHGTSHWPSMTVVLPGNAVCFSLETASDYVKDDKACFFGFKCTVTGYECASRLEEGLVQLEREIACLGGMCAASLMKKDIILPPTCPSEAEDDMDVSEEGAQQIFTTHSALLSKGFALSQAPNISQALDGNLPFCQQANERAFLRDFVTCTPSTSGGRLAAWLQPESYLDAKQCELIYNKDDLKCSWPAVLTVHSKDQYGNLVHVPNLKVEVKAVPLVKEPLCEDNRHMWLTSKYDVGSLAFGGHPPPQLETPYQVTVKDKKDAFHSICMMKAYENYSFEELRFAAPVVRCPSENMLVRANNDGTYSANWTPAGVGWYNVHVTIDGFDTSDVYKVEVKEPPHGVQPPMPNPTAKKPGHQPNKMRKFVGQWSSGLRVRLNPSLQSEQIGIIVPNGIISFIDEIHNDDGVWLRLSGGSIKKWCVPTNGFTEAWALQYNQHLGKTLLVPVEEPKSILDEIIKDSMGRRLPETGRDKRQGPHVGGPGVYQVVKCGSSGHNIRCRPHMKATPIGMLVHGNTVTAVEEMTNSEGTWVKLDRETMQHYCHEAEGEAWSLARGADDILYLQHESEQHGEEDGDPKASPFSFNSLPPEGTQGFDFSDAQHKPMLATFGTSEEGLDTMASSSMESVFGGHFVFSGFEGAVAAMPSPPSTWPTFGKTAAAAKERRASSPGRGSAIPTRAGSWGRAPGHGPSGAVPVPLGPVQLKPGERRDGLRDIPPELQGVSVKDLVKALGRLKVERQLKKPSDAAVARLTEAAGPSEAPGLETALQTVSVRDMIRLIGESRVNGNGVTPPRTPPGTPKKTLSRSSSPKAVVAPGHSPPRSPLSHQRRASSPLPCSSMRPVDGSGLLPPSPRRDAHLLSLQGSSTSSPSRTPPKTPPKTPPTARRDSYGSFSTPPQTPPTARRDVPGAAAHLTMSPSCSPPQRSSSSSPQRSPLHSLQRQTSSSPIRLPSSPGHFSIGSSSPKDDTRLSPKLVRKDRGRQLRSKRASSPAPKDKTPPSRSRSGSQPDRTKEVKEAMSPSMAECVRAVFAAFMWHEGIVHDAMAGASFLKFHPDLPKHLPKLQLPEAPTKDPFTSPGGGTKKPGASVQEVANLNEARVQPSVMSEPAQGKEAEAEPVALRNPGLELVRNKERCYSEGTPSDDDGGNQAADGEGDLPITLQFLVYFWKELSVASQAVVAQNLIRVSPAAVAKVKVKVKDKEREREKKGKKKKEPKPAGGGGRGNLFGEAAGGLFGGGDRETMCELCGGQYPHPVTYHMRQAHPGCGRHAGGQGYNSGGNFCGGWAGNCGDGGVGGSTWYLMCDRCREKYLREKRQALKEKTKKPKKKSVSVKPMPAVTVLDPHLVMKNNAMFLLDLASAAGFTLPAHPGPVGRVALPRVSEDTAHGHFSPTPFLYLSLQGAQAADSAFAEDIFQAQYSQQGDVGKLHRTESDGSHRKSEEGSRRALRTAVISPETELLMSGRQGMFQRSISEITGSSTSVENLDAYDGSVNKSRRRRNNSGTLSDGGMSLLKNPSAAMAKLIQSAEKSVGKPGGAERALVRPVMAFVTERHDLEGLQLAMRQALRKAACRVFALQALNWLVRNVTQPTCLHDLFWFFVASLSTASTELEEEEEGEGQKKEKREEQEVCMCEHPLSDITIGGEAVNPLPAAFHTFLQTIADVMMHLPPGSALQMAVRCWCLKFWPSDHVFLHKSHVFSNISQILSKSDEEWGEVANAANDNAQVQETLCVECLKDLTPLAELKASSRQAMIASLTDNSTETFWESGDEDRNKTKTITITANPSHTPRMVYAHIDNSRDLGNKISSLTFNAGTTVEDLERLKQVEVESRHSGWVSCCLPSSSTRVVRLELKGPDNSLRLRQVKLLGEVDGASLAVSGQRSPLVMQQQNCEAETLKVFRLLTSQVFGKLISEEGGEEDIANSGPKDESAEANEGDVDLKEHMVGILFSRSKLSHLQKQVCAHIVQAIRKETLRVREEWEASLAAATNTMSEEHCRGSDAYCFELLSMVLALSGSSVGRAYLAQQPSLIQDLLSLLHTASPRVQRQVTALLRRVLPEIPPATFASLLSVPMLPPRDFSILPNPSSERAAASTLFDPHRQGILDVFLSCISKALTVQTKVKGQGGSKGLASSHQLTDCLSSSCCLSLRMSGRWWLRGCVSSKLADTIITLLKDMAAGKLSEEWATVTKGAIAEAILALTKLDERLRVPAECIKMPTLWLSLASLCVLDQDHVERLSSGQWVRGGGASSEKSQPRPTCDNHDDGETPAIILCNECGNLCADCDRFLHLHRRTRSHHRQVFKEEEEAIRVDLHEGCGRIKLFWVMCLADSKTLKAMVEFREGTKGKLSSKGGVGTCRFCGSSDSTGLLAIGNVCSDLDCQRHAESACSRTLLCGHQCGGIRGEDPCLPCLHGCNDADSLRQDADDMCMICFTEAIAAAPAIQLACGHVFHLHCSRRVLERRWAGPRITFGFSLCPICKASMKHAELRGLLAPIQALYEDVRRKAQMRLEYEGLHKAEAITTPGARFHNDPAGYALERYAYYVCSKCHKAYYGGEARCEDGVAGGDDYDPAELVCGGCSDVARAQMCPKHGTDFLEYKCRYCCSVAVFFCFGTTHFCNQCHDDFQRVTNIPRSKLPRCPAGPKAKQLDGEECPLHVQHPPTGEEFALGCGVCRNAHTF